MGDLDGGSAAPATPDVPTFARRLNQPMVKKLRLCAADTSPNWDGAVTIYPNEARGLIALIDSLDHSGVAGEPKATTKEAPEIDSPSSPIPGHSPDPVIPSVELTTGCVVVPDEAVEAPARADHAFGRLGDDPDWDGLTDTDRDSYRRAARSYLTAAAPLIAAQALRQAAEEIRAELVCCDAYERDHDTNRAGRDSDHAICFWGEAAARINDGRADELERGGDQ